jgi:LuxR family transcriptional regulator, maltose regulon positive regulatory protein
VARLNSELSRRAKPLSDGWQALKRMEWAEARACFETAAARDASAEALEGLSLAAWWLEDARTMFEMRQRAYVLYRRRGDRCSAARLATLMAIDHYQFRGEAAIGNGWFRRAHRLLDGLAPAPEHGWLSIWEGQIALIAGNDPATAARLGRAAVALGQTLGLVDIEMTGLGLEGLALVTQGEVAAGMAKLDEASAAAVGGEMSVPNAIGATCCYLIYACERVRDFDRAIQWCDKMQALCREWRWLSLFALCRTHHAMVLLWQGAWSEAETELHAARRELDATRPGNLPNALIRLAELRRRQGRLEEAQTLLKQVRSHPHASLGLAAVALDRGKAVDALDLVHRFLRQIPATNRTDRFSAFELAVAAHCALGQTTDARACLAELQALADAVATNPMRASVTLAQGVLAAAEGNHAASRARLEDAVDLFEQSGAPYEAARARLALAHALAETGRGDFAAQEARAAHEALRKLGAAAAAPPGGARRTAFGLSARELEVLRLVAQGSRNQKIAAQLVLSEHTVRRHVANILRKLDAPSRAAAAALAARHELL